MLGFIIMILIGLFFIFCAVMNYDIIENRKTRFIIEKFGRMAARILYVLIGMFLLYFSFLIYINGLI